MMTEKEKAVTKALREKYRPVYDPDEEYRPVRYKRDLSFENYMVSKKGIVTSARRPKGLAWAAGSPNRLKKSIPKVGLMHPTEGNKISCYIHVIIAFTYMDLMNWDRIPREIMDNWDTLPPLVQDVLLNQCFEVDHIDDNTWNPVIENLQFMLPHDNKLKSVEGNNWGSRNAGKNHYTYKQKVDEEAKNSS